jgi:hypothetical protein
MGTEPNDAALAQNEAPLALQRTSGSESPSFEDLSPRVETVISNPYEFKVRRKGTRRGMEIVGWFPLPKGIAHLFRFAEVSLASNRRYLDALATVRDPSPAARELERLANQDQGPQPRGLEDSRAGFRWL